MNPWAQATFDTLGSVVSQNVLDEVIDRGLLEVLPLTHIRGRSLHDAFVIVDEAQNTSRLQMKMVLTRIGEGARMVVTATRPKWICSIRATLAWPMRCRSSKASRAWRCRASPPQTSCATRSSSGSSRPMTRTRRRVLPGSMTITVDIEIEDEAWTTAEPDTEALVWRAPRPCWTRTRTSRARGS